MGRIRWVVLVLVVVIAAAVLPRVLSTQDTPARTTKQPAGGTTLQGRTLPGVTAGDAALTTLSKAEAA